MPAATIDLTRHVRLRQVERQLLRLRTTRLFMRCVVLPAFGIGTVLLLQRMLAAGAHAGLDTLASGAFTLLLATTGFVTASRAARRRLEKLEAERSRLLQPPAPPRVIAALRPWRHPDHEGPCRHRTSPNPTRRFRPT